jgi:hypothetical protein
MSNAVDAAMDPVQTPRGHSSRDRTAAKADLLKLTRRDHAVLSRGSFRDQMIWLVDFVPHSETKSTPAPTSPPLLGSSVVDPALPSHAHAQPTARI